MKARIRIPNPGTSEHNVWGMQSDGNNVYAKPLVVRITSNEIGKSLSISNEDDVMLMIPLESIESRLKEVLK